MRGADPAGLASFFHSTTALRSVQFSCTTYRGRYGMVRTTYTNARANFAGLCDEVTKNGEIVIIGRRGGEDVAMIAADELQGLMETAHLLRSPPNAQRLLSSLERALKHEEK